MKLIKILATAAVGALCLFAAVYFTRLHVNEEAAREKSLAEALLQNQIKQEIQAAEQQAKEELGEALVTTVVTTRPPEPLPEPTEEATPTEETLPTIEAPTAEAPPTVEAPAEEIVTEFTYGMLPQNRDNLPSKSMITISDSERERAIRFLIEHYFLDGSVYVAAETRPALKAKKQLAHEMEQGAISAVNMLYSRIDMNNLSSVMQVDYSAIRDEVVELRDEFRREYRDCRVHGAEFRALYDGCLSYFDRMILALERLAVVANEYRNSTNPILAAALLMSKLESVVIPEVMAVIEGSFDLIEASHGIFLEGTTGTRLLTRQEVSDIIVNPALVLDTGLC